MASLSLPPPRRTAAPPAVVKKTPTTTTTSHPQLPPSYLERCQAAAEIASLSAEERRNRPKLFCPRRLDDFADGGAFPEIHIAQYPRHMGNPHLAQRTASATRGAQASSSALVSVEVNADGEVSYDAIVKGGTNSDKIVYSKHADVKGGPAKTEDIALPLPEEEAQVQARTQAALMALLGKKTAEDKPSGTAMVNAETSRNVELKTQFIKYTPNPEAPGYNPAAAQRVIQMVPKQIDPMQPPKHKHVKAPRGPAEDPVPVLHAPPLKLSKEEKAAWNIPACISNWKNQRGYTIPLDKRLAADGRGLIEHTINDNFATLSESLYVAERQARQEVRMRAQVQKKLAIAEKEKREEELRELANQARRERGGVVVAPPPKVSTVGDDDDDESVSDRDESDEESVPKPRGESEDDVAAQQRERLRLERKRERERELRLENSMEAKKRRLEEERDVSEKIALGVHTGTGGLGGEVDSRLYNQTAGMDSGFGAEDEYNTYSKPLFDRQGVTSSSIYRPTRGETEYNADEQYDKLKAGATSKFQPDQGFAGAEGGADVRAGPRTAPVQFEKGDK